MKRLMYLAATGAIAGLLACGSDVAAPIDDRGLATLGPGGSDSSGGTDTTQTSTGPVVKVVLTPQAFDLPLGYYRGPLAVALDAAGAPVRKTLSWRSSDPSIVTVGDTGVVFGKALGTAKIYASTDGFTDSATVTVVPAPPPPPPPAPAVAEFNLTVVAFGALPGIDTTQTARVPGATVTLQRRSSISGDSLRTPEDAGSAVTDANGEAKFAKLTGGTYSMIIAPPAGSGYATTYSGFAPPRQSDISVHVTLQKP